MGNHRKRLPIGFLFYKNFDTKTAISDTQRINAFHNADVSDKVFQ